LIRAVEVVDTRNQKLDEMRAELDGFYAAVDKHVRSLVKIHAKRLSCKRGCSGCCIDGLTVFEVEAEHIRFHCSEELKHQKPHPLGKCVFLDEQGACRIYENRPYVCRTQGLPLRWFDEDRKIEYRDICPLNENDDPIENLAENQCLTIGFFESWLAKIQLEFGNGVLRRLSLRELFEEIQKS